VDAKGAVTENEKDITGVEDLGDKTGATKLGTTSADFAKELETKDVKLFALLSHEA
jgi:ABC-type amino acid transport substrate-binding protein